MKKIDHFLNKVNPLFYLQLIALAVQWYPFFIHRLGNAVPVALLSVNRNAGLIY